VNPDYPDSIITFRQILLHTSSISDNLYVYISTTTCGDSPIPLGEFLQDYLVPGGEYYDAELNFNGTAPGSVYEYCSVTIGLAGFLVEHISGIPFDQYCKDSIFLPLDMDETSWRFADLDSNNIAMPYDWTFPTWVPYGHCSGIAFYPGGTMRSSTLQLARYLTTVMQWGEIDDVRVLDSTTVDTMNQVYLYRPDGMGQGLVWRGDYLDDRWTWSHTGGFNGASTAIAFTWQDSTGVIYLSNGDDTDGRYPILVALFSFGRDDDGDGIVNGYDNCDDVANPDQEDIDSDSYGDSCDNCPAISNLDQADADADGAGDSCDICPGFDDFADFDGDSWPDSCDNCPRHYNPEQLDSNGNGIGDACDWLCGDADGSGGDPPVDIDDVVYLIAYIFSGGPAPDPFEAGNADCSTADPTVDIDDVVYLIAFIFSGGNAPCDTDGDEVPDC
jgi:CubicO group peptidase (beta-lactamase class C family)